MNSKKMAAPYDGIVALAIFFAVAALISGASALSFIFPGSVLEMMWRINPRARIGFISMGHWAVRLLTILCVACIMAAVGLGRRQRWGYWFAVGLLSLNHMGDITHMILNADLRTLVGIPIVMALLGYLSRPNVRALFSSH